MLGGSGPQALRRWRTSAIDGFVAAEPSGKTTVGMPGPAPGVSRLVLVEPSAGAGVTPVKGLGEARPEAAVLLVGPEGGWAAGEVEGAAAAGWTPVSLGPRTLRAVSVPVVALTANALDADAARCLAAGMDGHLSKPIEPEALLAAVARYGSGSANVAT